MPPVEPAAPSVPQEALVSFAGLRTPVTLGDRTCELAAGQSIDIPRESLHCIENKEPGDVVFIEIQTGDYFGEDDIVRLEDDFGRVS